MKLDEDRDIGSSLRSIEGEIEDIASAYEEYEESDVDAEFLENALESCQDISATAANLFQVFQVLIRRHNS